MTWFSRNYFVPLHHQITRDRPHTTKKNNKAIKAVPKAFVDGIEGVGVHPMVVTIKR